MAACILQAEACRTGTLYVVNVVSAQGSVLSEVAFNSETGCLGANTVQVWCPHSIKTLSVDLPPGQRSHSAVIRLLQAAAKCLLLLDVASRVCAFKRESLRVNRHHLG